MGKLLLILIASFSDAAGAKRYQDVKITLPDFNNTPFNRENHGSFVAHN